jgi:hypothetical protein
MKKLLIAASVGALMLMTATPMILAGSKPAGHMPSARPTTHRPTTPKPAHRPTTPKPAHKPTTSKPAHKPTTSKPVHKPTTSKPVHRPTTSKPYHMPTTSKQVHKPTTYRPGYKPVAVMKPGKFYYGTYYSGLRHYHWTKRYYSTRWRNWFFWDPRTQVWYYWYATGARYYPVSVITTYTPTEAVLPCPGEDVTVGSEESRLLDVPQAESGDEPDLPEPPQTDEPKGE